MTLVDWKPAFKLGIPAVDHEHEELIGLLNELHESLGDSRSAAVVAEFLGEVFTRISGHFALEEKVMRDAGYDQLSEHKTDHEALLDQLRDIMDRFDEGGFDDLDGVLAQTLESWFVEHFKTHDARLHKRIGDAPPGIEEI